MIVCLEGIDAAGKATQAERLAKRLDARLLSFPNYGTRSGILIGDHLQQLWQARYMVEGQRPELDALVFQSLMLTNRMEAASNIRAAKAAGNGLVLDRYWPSGIAYGSADGLDFDWLLKIHEHLPQAHIYVLVDINPDLSARRRPERADRYEMQPGLMEEVASNYHRLWNMMRHKHPAEWAVVDGNGSIEQVESEIWDRVVHGGNPDEETL